MSNNYCRFIELLKWNILCSLNKLTWHNDTVPLDELWVKIGGDKGGSSFKMNFQLVNVNCPNSIHNTCVFTAFQAPDTITNLHVVLDHYKDQLTNLQKTKWRLDQKLQLYKPLFLCYAN